MLPTEVISTFFVVARFGSLAEFIDFGREFSFQALLTQCPLSELTAECLDQFFATFHDSGDDLKYSPTTSPEGTSELNFYSEGVYQAANSGAAERQEGALPPAHDAPFSAEGDGGALFMFDEDRSHGEHLKFHSGGF